MTLAQAYGCTAFNFCRANRGRRINVMAQLLPLVAVVVMFAGAQAGDMADRSLLQGLRSEYMGSDASKTFLGDYNKFMTHPFSHMKHGGAPEARSHHNGPAEHGSPIYDSQGVDANGQHGGMGASIVFDKPARPAALGQGSVAFSSVSMEPLINTKDFDLPKVVDKEEEKAMQKLLAAARKMPAGMSAIGVSLFVLVTMLGVRMRRGQQQATAFASSGVHESGMSTTLGPALVENILEMNAQKFTAHKDIFMSHGWLQCSGLTPPGLHLVEMKALNPLQKLLVEGELRQRPIWIDGSTAQVAPRVWRWVRVEDEEVLALPDLSDIDARRLAESLEAAGVQVEASATRRVPTLTKRLALSRSPHLDVPSADECRRRTEAFVERVLVGLRQCPFTASPGRAGVGLEEFGVQGAPILYAHSRCTTAPHLVSDVWETLGTFLEGGEAMYSSVLLTVPAFDADVTTWVETVFPLLEESLVAARVSRDVGIVCFHPLYQTPSKLWLATHRFGHMYAPD